MDKFCIFCGGKPDQKTKEHILPQWLIKLTGNPRRKGLFGYNMTSQDRLQERVYAFQSFTFPACIDCNSSFSNLEANAKSTLLKILNDEIISTKELDIFLDWLDKVRVGLWLGMLILDGNLFNIEPSFHIASRIGQHDRILIVEKSDATSQKLNFAGVETPSFTTAPCAFVLTINNYYFTNISSSFLFSHRLGFPSVMNLKKLPDSEKLEGDFISGHKRIMRPIMKRVFREQGNIFYQPIFPNGLSQGHEIDLASEYLNKHCIDICSAKGNIFTENGVVNEYTKFDNILLKPEVIQNDEQLVLKSIININNWQTWILDQTPSLELLSKEQRRFVRKRLKFCKEINNFFIEHHERILKNIKPDAKNRV